MSIYCKYNFSTQEETLEAIELECNNQGLKLPEQIAYVLATVEHETAGTFKPVKEAFWQSERWRQQNFRYYPYYGRGFVQLTWEYNYRKYSELLDIDLVEEPEKATDPDIALFILVHGFVNGIFTGKKITDYINEKETDFVNARRCINGTDKAEKIAGLARKYLPSNSIKPISLRKGNFSVRLSPGRLETIIKHAPVQSDSIPTYKGLAFNLDNEKQLEINWFEEIDNHYKFELEEPVNNRFNWFAFAPHVVIYDDELEIPVEDIAAGNHDINTPKLKIPYFSQRDNKIRPHQTCNMTCSAMVVEYFYPGTNAKTAGQLEDKLTRYCTSNWGRDAIYYHDKIVKTLAHWGVKSEFSTTTSFSKIKAHLSSGNPVIYSGKFTRSGHIVVLTGYDNTGFWVNDPWGEWFSWGYKPTGGEQTHYSYNMMANLSYSGSAAGWAHLCTKVN